MVLAVRNGARREIRELIEIWKAFLSVLWSLIFAFIVHSLTVLQNLSSLANIPNMDGQIQCSRSLFPCSILTAQRRWNAGNRSRAVSRIDWGSTITILSHKALISWGSDQWNKWLSLSLFFSNLKEDCAIE